VGEDRPGFGEREGLMRPRDRGFERRREYVVVVC